MARAASQNDPLTKVYVIGAPGPIGGASTELWHTLRLWRSYGVDVVVVPTWEINDEWRQKCRGIGCTVCQPESRERLLDVPGVRGSIVVSFCDKRFLENAAALRTNGCKTVWVNCMTWMLDDERRVYEQQGLFDHYVFQTEYQQSQLVPHLRKYDYREDQGSVIRGAFCVDEFPFQPLRHERGAPFVIGRISRADVEKYSADTWSLYGRIPHPIRARVMAWNRRTRRKLGVPPDWAECLRAGSETAQEFFGTLHCMLQVNGGARENWPRSGLEAMACGVPVVAENRWGWPEMLRNGETGYLCDTEDELVFYVAKLAYDEQHRMELVTRARFVLETELADPQTIWAGWRRVFRLLGATTRAPEQQEPHHA